MPSICTKQLACPSHVACTASPAYTFWVAARLCKSPGIAQVLCLLCYIVSIEQAGHHIVNAFWHNTVLSVAHSLNVHLEGLPLQYS